MLRCAQVKYHVSILKLSHSLGQLISRGYLEIKSIFSEQTGNLVRLLRKLAWLITSQARGPGKEQVCGLCARLREGQGSCQTMGMLWSSWPWQKACPSFPWTCWLTHSHPPCPAPAFHCCLHLVSDARSQHKDSTFIEVECGGHGQAFPLIFIRVLSPPIGEEMRRCVFFEIGPGWL